MDDFAHAVLRKTYLHINSLIREKSQQFSSKVIIRNVKGFVIVNVTFLPIRLLLNFKVDCCCYLFPSQRIIMIKNIENQAFSQIRALPFFESLQAEQVQQLLDIGQLRKIGRHDLFYDKGMSSDILYFLLDGVVKIGSIADENREIIKRVIYAPNLFGELGLVGETKRHDFAMNISDEGTVLAIPIEQFKEFMARNMDLSLSMINWIGIRLRKVEARLESMIFKDARERIIDFLKDSAESQGKKIGYELLIKHYLTQQDIANFTGTSRQTVTSVLNELKKSNLIHFNRRSILIRDLAKLV